MVILKPGRDRGLAAMHPWIYRGAVDEVRQGTELSQPLPVVSRDGGTLAWGFYSQSSQIAVRIICYGAQMPEEDWIERRLRAARELRDRLDIDSDAYRLVNAEGDRLPGLVVDIYRRTAVIRPLIRGMEGALERVVSVLNTLYPGSSFFLKRDERIARIEGLARPTGYLRGEGGGVEEIREHGLNYLVDFARGQKTGFYLDQRDNRRLMIPLSKGKRVLNLFAYTGSFSLAAASGGAAEVDAVESSPLALEYARRNCLLNPGLASCRFAWYQEDAFGFLERCGSYDLVVCDPPPFARNRSQLEGALRGYRQLNRLALSRLNPGGMLMSFSCSQAVTAERLREVMAEAAVQAGREVRVLKQLQAAPDHPYALQHPEGEYLKGWLLYAC